MDLIKRLIPSCAVIVDRVRVRYNVYLRSRSVSSGGTDPVTIKDTNHDRVSPLSASLLLPLKTLGDRSLAAWATIGCLGTRTNAVIANRLRMQGPERNANKRPDGRTIIGIWNAAGIPGILGVIRVRINGNAYIIAVGRAPIRSRVTNRQRPPCRRRIIVNCILISSTLRIQIKKTRAGRLFIIKTVGRNTVFSILPSIVSASPVCAEGIQPPYPAGKDGHAELI